MMSDEEIHGIFKNIRWADTNGELVCPNGGSILPYNIKTRQQYSHLTKTIDSKEFCKMFIRIIFFKIEDFFKKMQLL